MKKPIAVILSIILTLFLVSCSGGGEGIPEGSFDRPPAFSVLQKQMTLVKHSEKGETTAFMKSDFSELLGEELTFIKVSSLPDTAQGTLIFKGASVILGQTIPAGSLEYLKFIPNGEVEFASFGFSCDAKSFNGKDMSL